MKECAAHNCNNEFEVKKYRGAARKYCSHNCQTKAYAKKEQLLNPDLVRKRRAEFRKKNPRSVRNSELKKRYNITLDQYNSLLMGQSGVCKICSNKCPVRKVLSVDHDHKTGRIRGLLCSACNHAIGLFRDNPDLMLSAANYILTHKAEH